MQPHGIVVMLPFMVVLYLVIRRPGGSKAKSSGLNVDRAIPTAMALIGCALLALRIVS